jgi:hypothetical protein
VQERRRGVVLVQAAVHPIQEPFAFPIAAAAPDAWTKRDGPSSEAPSRVVVTAALVVAVERWTGLTFDTKVKAVYSGAHVTAFRRTDWNSNSQYDKYRVRS